MGKMTTLTCADDHMISAYHADADGERGRRGGLVVIQEIFGVNDHIRSVCDDFAGRGFEVYAPALFDRVERKVELGYGEADIERGRALRGQLEWTGTLLDIQAAVAEMRSLGEVGIVGYCFGGSAAWLAACRVIGVSAAVCYYGGQIRELVDNQPRCPVMMHFGKKDSMIPPDHVAAIRKAHPNLQIFEYDADHGFNCDHRASYDEAAAKAALDRTMAFFTEHVLSP